MRHLVFHVGGQARSVARIWWRLLDGPLPEPPYPTDGCSCSPDKVGTFILWPACVIHDYHYRTGILGGTWQGRQAADAAFRRNIITLVTLQGGTRAQALRLAWLYWGRVRVWGAGAYVFATGQKLPVLRRVADVWKLTK